MGGIPEVKWGDYEQSVIHVRTSHVPRFEVEIPIEKAAVKQSLFDEMGIRYDDFRKLQMPEKMKYIRAYARKIHPDGRLWWIEEKETDEHTVPVQARLYTNLTTKEKTRLRAEAALLCPQIVDSGRSHNKYDDMVLYLLTYHGIICHQARDLFSAGSVANPQNDDEGGIYIERALKLIENEMREAARIQSFPDSFRFHSGLRETERQIGNAVPPVLAWYVAKTVETLIEGKNV
jgi:site-specific DNA-cytosine methylase